MDQDVRDADAELANWGRSIHDGWLKDHLLYANVPTSDGYVAPVVGYDDPEPARHPVDQNLAQITEAVVITLFQDHIDSYRVLQHWYTRLLPMRGDGIEATHDEMIKRLAKHMRTSYPGAQRMLDDARRRYWQRRGNNRLTAA